MSSKKMWLIICRYLVVLAGFVSCLVYGFSWAAILPWLGLATVLTLFIRFRSYKQFYRWLRWMASYF